MGILIILIYVPLDLSFGDWNWAYKEEAERVMKGASARVIR